MLLGSVILLLSNCNMVQGTVNFAWQMKYSEMTLLLGSAMLLLGNYFVVQC